MHSWNGKKLSCTHLCFVENIFKIFTSHYNTRNGWRIVIISQEKVWVTKYLIMASQMKNSKLSLWFCFIRFMHIFMHSNVLYIELVMIVFFSNVLCKNVFQVLLCRIKNIYIFILYLTMRAWEREKCAKEKLRSSKMEEKSFSLCK
jgi:hypothetical protein